MRTWKALTLGVLVVVLAVPGTGQAENILFNFVDSTSYVADGNQLAAMIGAVSGYNVTTRFLNAAIYNDYASFDQVWVYDLVTGSDNNATQAANYQNIANWYNGLTNRNLIVDGRIISSAPDWTNAGGFPPENAWIQRYATLLDNRGGGLVLGTDHDVFQNGINQINNLIGINPFQGFYYDFGQFSQAQVDTASPLYVPIASCLANPALRCINDNSSTGFVPTGAQPNGQFLTPVAYHGTVSTAFDNAAVAATFGSPTFPAPEPSTLLLLGIGLAGAALGRRGRRA